MNEEQAGVQSEIEAAAPLTPKRSKTVLIGAVILALALVSGGSAFAYIKYFRKEPVQVDVLKQVFEKMSTVKTFEYALAADSKSVMIYKNSFVFGNQSSTIDDIKRETRYRISAEGAADISDPKNMKSKTSVSLTMNLSGDGDVTATVEGVQVGNVTYLSLKKIDMPATGMAIASLFDFGTIENKWIKIDRQAIIDKLGLKKYEEKIIKNREKTELSTAELSALKDEFLKDRVLKISGKTGSDTIAGIPADGYDVEIDRVALKTFLANAEQIIGEKMTAEESVEFNKMIVVQPPFKIKIWVDKDYFLRKISFSLPETTTTTSYSTVTKATEGSFVYKSFNGPVQVEAPADARNLEDIISEMLGGYAGMFGGLTTTAFSTSSFGAYDFDTSSYAKYEVDTDNDGLADYLEKIYGTDPKKPDTDGDGFKDGDEVTKGYNPLGAGKLYEDRPATAPIKR